MRHVADALIGLAALVDQLLQPGLRSRAVEHDIGRHRRCRVGGASGKQIAVAGLAVEQRHRIRERRLRRDLAGGLTVVVEHDGRRAGRSLHRSADVGQSLQRKVGDVEPRIDVLRGVRIGIQAADLRTQAQRKAAIGALPRIGIRNPAAGELLREIIELLADVEDRGPDIGCPATNAIDRHETLTWPGSACRTSA